MSKLVFLNILALKILKKKKWIHLKPDETEYVQPLSLSPAPPSQNLVSHAFMPTFCCPSHAKLGSCDNTGTRGFKRYIVIKRKPIMHAAIQSLLHTRLTHYQ